MRRQEDERMVASVRTVQPASATRPAADPVHEPPGERHRQRGPDPVRRHEQPRVQRAAAARHLVIQRQQEHRAEHRRTDEEGRARG